MIKMLDIFLTALTVIAGIFLMIDIHKRQVEREKRRKQMSEWFDKEVEKIVNGREIKRLAREIKDSY